MRRRNLFRWLVGWLGAMGGAAVATERRETCDVYEKDAEGRWQRTHAAVSFSHSSTFDFPDAVPAK